MNDGKLDFAQRIQLALENKTTIKRFDGAMEFDESTMTKTDGEVVPVHLQGLWALMENLGDEARAVIKKGRAAVPDSAEDFALRKQMDSLKRQVEAIQSMFYESLQEHFPAPEHCSGIGATEGWQVVYHLETEDDESEGHPMAQLLQHLKQQGAVALAVEVGPDGIRLRSVGDDEGIMGRTAGDKKPEHLH